MHFYIYSILANSEDTVSFDQFAMKDGCGPFPLMLILSRRSQSLISCRCNSTELKVSREHTRSSYPFNEFITIRMQSLGGCTRFNEFIFSHVKEKKTVSFLHDIHPLHSWPIRWDWKAIRGETPVSCQFARRAGEGWTAERPAVSHGWSFANMLSTKVD